MDDRAGLFRPGWIARSSVYGLDGGTASGKEEGRLDALLCSCNARSQKTLVGHAQWETI